MYQIKHWLVACLTILIIPQAAFSEQAEDQGKTIGSFSEKVKDLVHMDGFFDLYWDQASGQLLLRIDKVGEEFIYQSSMPRGDRKSVV